MNHFNLPAIFLLLCGVMSQAEEGIMTLDDKRFLASMKSEKLPEIQKAVEEATGTKMKVEVEWDSFQTRESLKMLEYTLNDLAGGLKEIARDEIGKKALSDQVVGIKIVNNDNDDWSKTGIIKDKTFLMEWDFDKGAYVNGSMISQTLNKKL